MADETSSSAVEEASVTFHVKASSDARYTVTVPRSMTVRELKEKLAASEYSDCPADRQRLIYSGRVLKDPDQLATYNVREGNTVHLVRSAVSNQAPGGGAAGSSSSSTAGPGSTGGNAAPTVPSNLATGPGNNPLAGLVGARYAGLAQLPGASMFGPDGGMGAPPDAEGIASMLSDPQFASTINQALADPSVVDAIIEQNPTLREMGPLARQMMRTEEFRRMLTDPNALRQVAQMGRRMNMGGMGLGMGMGMDLGGAGGAGGSNGFPAPGITDTTPADAGGSRPTPNQPNTTGAGNAANLPVEQRIVHLLAGGPPLPSNYPSMGPINPFAALFNPLAGQAGSSTTPSTGSAPAASGAGSSGPASPPTSNQQQPGGGEGGPSSGFDPSSLSNEVMRQFFASLSANGATGRTNGNADHPPTTGGGNGSGSAPFDPGSLVPFLTHLLNQPGGASPGAINPFQPPSVPSASASPAPPVDTRPPEERYEHQLRQLNDMGFFDFDRNVEALRRSGGSVNGAVEYLLTH